MQKSEIPKMRHYVGFSQIGSQISKLIFREILKLMQITATQMFAHHSVNFTLIQ